MEYGGRKGTQRMRLGRDGVWWEKGNTENEVEEGWSMVGERKHRAFSVFPFSHHTPSLLNLIRDGVWWEKGNTENEVGEGWNMVGEREHRE